MIPLVEVVGGNKTSPEAIQQAMTFYAAIGKKPIRLGKKLPGHAANRLQAALYREVVYQIEQGILSVEDADAAVRWGPGLRWAVMGPSLLWHLGGGEGGIHHFMEQFIDPLAVMMKNLGIQKLLPSLNKLSPEECFARPAIVLSRNSLREESEILLGLLRLLS
jgi:3-hydroxyacyl-CoA dehydrogenase